MMEKRYIDLIHELQDCDTARNFVLARAEAAEADARECRAERARYGDMMTERLAAVEADRIAARALAVRMRRERDEYAAAHEQLSCGHPAAFIAAPAGCDPRCELCAVRAERDALRERCIEWLPFNEAAQDCQGSLLVWREDAGTFVAFYDDDARCWFTERGEDLTGDLPAYYAKMPQGPTSK